MVREEAETLPTAPSYRRRRVGLGGGVFDLVDRAVRRLK